MKCVTFCREQNLSTIYYITSLLKNVETIFAKLRIYDIIKHDKTKLTSQYWMHASYICTNWKNSLDEQHDIISQPLIKGNALKAKRV